MLEQYRDRLDSDIYAHPEIKDSYESANGESNIAGHIFNSDIPYEVRKAEVKENYESFRAIMPPPKDALLMEAPGCPEEPDAPPVPFSVIKPKNAKENKKLPCVFEIPGGALYQCMDMACPTKRYAKTYNAVIVCTKYRTYFDENGCYPAAVNDLHAVYAWVHDHAEELGIDKNKIIIKGMSSGGHLSLSLCHRLKRYGYSPRGCQVIGAIADERTIYPSSNVRKVGWNGDDLYYSSQAWLGKLTNPVEVPAEAFANHATVEECVGLPPTSLHIFEGDPSLDSNMIYASKLIQAGVFTHLQVWGGCNHEGLINAYLSEIADDDTTYPNRFMRTVDEEIIEFIKYDLKR